MTHLLLASSHVQDHDGGQGPWWPLFPVFWLHVIGTAVFFAGATAGSPQRASARSRTGSPAARSTPTSTGRARTS